jgi:molecular chaperone DnaK (HSP70)
MTHDCTDGWKTPIAESDLFCRMCGAKLIVCQLEPREIRFVTDEGREDLTQDLCIDNSESVRNAKLLLRCDNPAIRFGKAAETELSIDVAAKSKFSTIVQINPASPLATTEGFETSIVASLTGSTLPLDSILVRGGHEPRFEVSVSELPPVEAGGQSIVNASIRHVSGITATLKGIRFEPPNIFDQTGLQPGTIFSKGTMVGFKVACRTAESGGYGLVSGILHLDFDTGKVISIPCQIDVKEPSAIKITSVGRPVPLGILSDITLKIRAQGTKPIRIVAVEFPESPKWLRPIRAALPATLDPNGEPFELRCVVHSQPDWKQGEAHSTVCTVKSEELPLTPGTICVSVIASTEFEDYAAIDFGTTNSCVAYWKDHKVNMVPFVDWEGNEHSYVPSVAYFDEQTGQWLAGFDAIAKADQDGKYEHMVHSVKRCLNEGLLSDRRKVALANGTVIEPETIATVLIKYLKAQAERHLHQELKNVVITLPANFTDTGVQATLKCASEAGLATFNEENAECWNDYRLDEPTAAAIEAAATRSFSLSASEEMVLVFDFGGGTLDVCILLVIRRPDLRRIKVLAHKGANWLGGDDFTARIMNLITSKFVAAFPGVTLRYDVAHLKHMGEWDNLDEEQRIDVYRNYRLLWDQAEKAKVTLSAQENVPIALSLRIAGGKKHFDTTITRTEFEAAISGLVGDAMRIVHRTIARAKEVRPIDLDSITKVIASGKTSLVPLVRRQLAELFDLKEFDRHEGFDEKECVARGAVHYAFQNLQGVGSVDEAPLECEDLHEKTNCSYGIGRNAGIDIAQIHKFKVLIPEGRLLDCRDPSSGFVRLNNARLAEIPLYQHTGDLSEDGADVIDDKNRDVVPIDAIKISNVPRHLRNSQVKVTMRLGCDGMLEAEAQVEGHDTVFRLDNRYGA